LAKLDWLSIEALPLSDRLAGQKSGGLEPVLPCEDGQLEDGEPPAVPPWPSSKLTTFEAAQSQRELNIMLVGKDVFVGCRLFAAEDGGSTSARGHSLFAAARKAN
jgi:hypothetical protein